MNDEAIYIRIEPEVRRALGELANRDYRDTRQQIQFILRRECEQAGLIEPAPFAQVPAGGVRQ
jgi:hypothetical protein